MRRAAIVRLLGVAGFGALGAAFVRRRALASDAMTGMMGGSMMSGARSTDMQTVMQLFADHGRIRRTVTLLPDGVRTKTESSDPAVAALLQRHVASMFDRVETHRPFSMMSRTLPFLFRHSNDYRRTLVSVPEGVLVTETSRDPQTIAMLHAHAKEVTGFVDRGMSAMMDGMGSM